MSKQLVEVGRFFDLQEAEVVKTLLVGCGIPAEVFGDNQGNMVPYQAMVAPTRVLVPADRLEEARAILAANPPVPGEDDGEDAPAPEGEGRVLVRRLFVAAVLGLFILPVIGQFYSLWLSREAWPLYGKLNTVDRLKLMTATCVNLAVLGLIGLFGLARAAPLWPFPGSGKRFVSLRTRPSPSYDSLSV